MLPTGHRWRATQAFRVCSTCPGGRNDPRTVGETEVKGQVVLTITQRKVYEELYLLFLSFFFSFSFTGSSLLCLGDSLVVVHGLSYPVACRMWDQTHIP